MCLLFVCVLLTGSEWPILDCLKRMKIAIGSTRGRAYLHDGCKYILHLCYDIIYCYIRYIKENDRFLFTKKIDREMIFASHKCTFPSKRVVV